ncbi:MAG: phosphoribosylglycinamide formyltransferase [Amylibacter sp.]|nr:phosphoribosylglycinamide formyltransferase [Amylibacter sp.]|tara:strand:- start:11 stop:589 length:579 start_codon:yes stop_codon:yes gene_type:complete
MPKRVAIFISGSGSNMVKLIKAMQSGLIDAIPVIVISNSKTATGIQKALELQVTPIVISNEPFNGDRTSFETAIHNILIQHKVDIICLAGFMRILTHSFIKKWNNKILNIHPSLLPKYKGLKTHQRALNAGDSHGGCSVHIVTSELDDGPILGQKAVAILPNDTSKDLSARVLIEEHHLYQKVLAKFVKDCD